MGARRTPTGPVDLSKSTYLTFADLAQYLCYRGKARNEAARKFALRHGLPKTWRGNAWLVKRTDVDLVLAGGRIRPRLDVVA